MPSGAKVLEKAQKISDATTEVIASTIETGVSTGTPYSVLIVMFAVFVAFVAAASCGLPLLFDGCNYLYTVVHYSQPCLPYYRNALALVHYPAIWAAQLTGQL